MAYAASYAVDLAKYNFDDSSSVWIQAMPLGNYNHPLHGPINITPERVQHFVDNVKNNVRGQDLDVDYDHKEKSGEAAGWVKDAQNRGSDGLWLQVDFNEDAHKKLKARKYRYFSPEFNDEWTHPQNGTFKDVLFGGALTNRPFLKGILPINLSEVFDEATSTKSNEGGREMAMTPERIKNYASKLGLGSEATEEEVLAALDDLEIREEEEEETEENEPSTETVSATETVSDRVKKLAESSTDPTIKSLAELFAAQSVQIEAQNKLLNEAAGKIKLAEVTGVVRQLNELAAKQNATLTPVAQEAMTKALMEPGNTQTVVDALQSIIEQKVVSLNERGSLKLLKDGQNSSDTETKFLSEAKKLAEADKISFADAMEDVARRDPELWEQYRSGSYAVGGES